MFSSNSDWEWERYGKRDPYFGVLTDPIFSRENLTSEHAQAFFQSGAQHVTHVLSVIRRHFDGAFSPRRVLDFGCGVGRLLIPFAEIADEVVGIDVSPSMLEEAKNNCREQGLKNIELIRGDDRLQAVAQGFDLVHSFIVFQHIDPVRGELILHSLLDRLAPGGICAVHLTYDRRGGTSGFSRIMRLVRDFKRATLRCLRLDLGRPVMEMNSYDIAKIMNRIQMMGVPEFYTEFTDHGGELGVMLYFQKPPT